MEENDNTRRPEAVGVLAETGYEIVERLSAVVTDGDEKRLVTVSS
jgi:hypothetical protein